MYLIGHVLQTKRAKKNNSLRSFLKVEVIVV